MIAINRWYIAGIVLFYFGVFGNFAEVADLFAFYVNGFKTAIDLAVANPDYVIRAIAAVVGLGLMVFGTAYLMTETAEEGETQ